MYRAIKMSGAGLVVAALVGCAVTYKPVNLPCAEQQRPDIVCPPYISAKQSNGDPYASLIYAFNAANARIDLSNSNVSVIEASGNATLVLRRNGAALAYGTFPYYLAGTQVYFSNPGAVTAWVHSHGYDADEFDIAFDSFRFSKNPGANTVVIEYLYDGVVQTGQSWSAYIPPGGGGSTQPY